MMPFTLKQALPLAQWSLGIVVAGVVSLVVHRRVFHPLSKYPGPFLNSLTQLVPAFHLLSGRQFVYYKKLHEKYGPVVRVAPNELSFSAGTSIDDIYGLRVGSQPMEKDKIFALSVRAKPPYPMGLAPRELHSKQRRVFASVYTQTALSQQEDIIRGYVKQLIHIFEDKARNDTAVVEAAWFRYLALDVIGSLAFDSPFGCLDIGNYNEWSSSITKALGMGAYQQAASRLAGFDTWLEYYLIKLLAPKDFTKWSKIHVTNAISAVTRRLEDVDSEHKDFVYYVLRNNESKSLLTEGEIKMTLLGMITAGGETVSTFLIIWSLCMGMNREVYRKLRDQIRSAFTTSEDIKWTTLRDMKYLDAVIHETSRYLSGVQLQRIRVVPDGGATIDGNFVPGGTTVGVVCPVSLIYCCLYEDMADYAATHLTSNFSNPYQYMPERWLDHDSSDQRHLHKPFSHGPRDCIGKNLAGMEIRLTIANILFHFDLDIESIEGRNWQWNPKNDFEHLRALNFITTPPLYLKITKVNSQTS